MNCKNIIKNLLLVLSLFCIFYFKLGRVIETTHVQLSLDDYMSLDGWNSTQMDPIVDEFSNRLFDELIRNSNSEKEIKNTMENSKRFIRELIPKIEHLNQERLADRTTRYAINVQEGIVDEYQEAKVNIDLYKKVENKEKIDKEL